MEKRTLKEVLNDPNCTWEDIAAAMPPEARAEIEADMDREVQEWKDGFGEFLSTHTGKPYPDPNTAKPEAKDAEAKEEDEEDDYEDDDEYQIYESDDFKNEP